MKDFTTYQLQSLPESHAKRQRRWQFETTSNSGTFVEQAASSMSTEDHNLISSLDERIRKISREVLQQELSKENQRTTSPLADGEARLIKQLLQRIMSKEFISAKEAAILLNCSERHIHNLVDRARSQTADHPIPFRKIGETTTFLRTELLEWTKGQSSATQLRAVS
jgi:hypothetical protein